MLDEYVIGPGRRVLTHTLIWSGAVLLMMLGTYAILMFQKDQAYINSRRNARHGEVVNAPAEHLFSPAESLRVVPAFETFDSLKNPASDSR